MVVLVGTQSVGAEPAEDEGDSDVLVGLRGARQEMTTQTMEIGSERMEITPLGAGCEVGRSCCIVRFRGATIMFDCGVHPAYSGLASLPYLDEVDLSTIDILLVTHFHMDHCGAVPYLTEKTNFKGRVFMTHPTKAIFKILQHDAVKVGHEGGRLFDEKDMLTALDKIELINYHENLEHKGIKFTCYQAGHVLGAAMFQIEVAGVRVLYTGDFSSEEDRHLLGAEIPTEPPHVLIVESTYGVSLHEPRAVREQRFTSAIHQIVARGGKCLIPVFALGRSQEILLILDEYWKRHPELQHVPIYYASKVAKKSMRVYQTYINMMNEHIRLAHAAGTNPWDFTHVQNLDFGKGGTTAISNFDDTQPMIVMASPGMMQVCDLRDLPRPHPFSHIRPPAHAFSRLLTPSHASSRLLAPSHALSRDDAQSGFSRELFEMWCSDKRNGLMMPGYSVAGTLAHHLISEPKEITTSTGDRVPVNLAIHYISFSAHSDYAQTCKFIQQIAPAHVVLVHGAEDVMGTMQRELVRHFKGSNIDFLMPKNCQSVHLKFRGDKVARVVGSLASRPPTHGLPLDGLLIKKDFQYTLMAAEDLPSHTPLASITVVQKPSFRYDGPLDDLLRDISSLFQVAPMAPPEPPPTDVSDAAAVSSSSAEPAKADARASMWRIHESLQLTHNAVEGKVVLSWPSGPLNDMIADAVAASLLQLQARHLSSGKPSQVVNQAADATPVKLEVGGDGAAAAGSSSSAAAVIKADRTAASGRVHVLKVLEEHFGPVKPLDDAAATQLSLEHKSRVGEETGGGEGSDQEPRAWWELMACGQRVLLEAAGPVSEADEAIAPPFGQLVCDDVTARERVSRVIDLAHCATALVPAKASELVSESVDEAALGDVVTVGKPVDH